MFEQVVIMKGEISFSSLSELKGFMPSVGGTDSTSFSIVEYMFVVQGGQFFLLKKLLFEELLKSGSHNPEHPTAIYSCHSIFTYQMYFQLEFPVRLL